MYKKLIILTIALILTGAGCVSVPKNIKNTPTPTPVYIPEATDTPTPTATVTPTPSPTETPVLAPTPTSTAEVDTSNWKAYTNKEYGFSFRYPESWVLKISSDGSSDFGYGLSCKFNLSVINSVTEEYTFDYVDFCLTNNNFKDYQTYVMNEGGTKPSPLIDFADIKKEHIDEYVVFSGFHTTSLGINTNFIFYETKNAKNIIVQTYDLDLLSKMIINSIIIF